MTWSRGQIQKTKSSTHTAKVVADHQPLPKYDCSCLSNELTARDRPQVFRAAAQRVRDGLVGRRLVNQKRNHVPSRPQMVHCYQTHTFEKQTREQGRSASHSSGRGTLHTPQARPSHRIHRSAGGECRARLLLPLGAPPPALKSGTRPAPCRPSWS